MKKNMIMVLVILLGIQGAMAKDFSASMTLGKHKIDNPFGIWSLDTKSTNTKQFKSKILPKTEFDKYPCLQYVGGEGCWDIRIIDVLTYKKEFLKHSYYHFFWKKKHKGFTHPDGEKINASISKRPQVMLHLTNNTASTVTLLSITSKSIYLQGGVADSTEYRVEPNIKKGAMEISYNKSDQMTFPNGYKLTAGAEITLPLSLWVKNATEGDGTGDLAYALVLQYKKDGKQQSEVLVNILQGDGEGYDVTVGGIAPIH
jgi:hypothetical protein